MTYTLKVTGEFKRSLKRCLKRGYDSNLITEVLNILKEKGELPKEYKPHRLRGQYEGLWECHIAPDWLLVWDKKETELLLILMRTGTHSDIFK